MTREEAIKEIKKVFEPAFANYIVEALTKGATASDRKSKEMTREEAKEVIEDILIDVRRTTAEEDKALRMAIEALMHDRENMNKTDAAEILQKYVFDDGECIAQDMKDYNEALKMAIEALSAEATDVYKAHEEEHLNIVNRIKELQYAIAKTQTIVGEMVESADAEPTVIRSKTLMPTKDFKEWAKRVREGNPNVIVIPCDAELVSAEAVSIHEDGTLEVKVPNAHKVGRVLVKDADSHIGGGLFYPDREDGE